MSYLDDLKDILGSDFSPSDDFNFDDEPLEVDAEVVGETNPLQRARSQFEGARTNYSEGPEGVFHASGTRYGCGFAEALVTVDPETGYADVLVSGGVRVSPENVKAARKICRRLNQDFIYPGLEVADDGELLFHPGRVDLNDPEADVEDVVGKGFSTIHAHVRVAMELEAGRAPWDVMLGDGGSDEDGSDEDDLLARLRSML